MRLALAVVTGAAATAAGLDRGRGAETPLLPLFFILVAIGVGFFAARRGWLAAVLAYYGGLLAYLLLVVRPGWATDVVVYAYPALVSIPFALVSAVGGAIGAHLRRVTLRH